MISLGMTEQMNGRQSSRRARRSGGQEAGSRGEGGGGEAIGVQLSEPVFWCVI